LAGTKGEAEDIAALLHPVTVLEGAAATVDAVRQVRQPAVLHLATHGFFSPLDELDVTEGVDLLPISDLSLLSWRQAVPVANPMYFSGVALAGANRRVPGTGTGILTAQEMAGMDLRGTQLVVLSACQTGLGTVKRGEEFVGLRRALAIAGAATQVTSLWKVNDEATRALMGQFYRGIAGGEDRAEALQRAQRQVEGDSRHPEWAHPFFWAGFVLSGAWEPVPGGLVERRSSDGDPPAGGPRP
jgi:CHAT domain-containing protein